jgi:hypothetical protein
MVGQAWRATFFLMVAAIAAFHRHLLAQETPETEEAKEVAAERKRESLLSPALRLTPLQPAYITSPMALTMNQMAIAGPGTLTTAGTRVTAVQPQEEPEPTKPFWNKIAWVDLLFVTLFTFATIRFWSYIITNM